ncbi:hypothetical protein ACIOHS_36190 [Streptomyces sp. NPDC088253]|uniref:hypothetical protein n=1 Tax=Streptomyces sp. NPDC088253 TaxID=3365846 RepID=UPI00382D50AB
MPNLSALAVSSRHTFAATGTPFSARRTLTTVTRTFTGTGVTVEHLSAQDQMG